jgi:prepilin-type N-terminal cleavage/methylation domain-containing protein
MERMTMNGRSEPRHAGYRLGHAGYSLVEVLIAMALLGTVLMSIITLFYFGRRNVYSGRQQTKITAVGTRVMEDLAGMTADDVRANFNVPAGATLASTCATINQVAYTNCIARTTTNIATGTDPGLFLTRWKDLLGSATAGQRTFMQPAITVIITPVASGTTPGSFVRVRAILQWREGSRVRYSVYDASKIQRPNNNMTS